MLGSFLDLVVTVGTAVSAITAAIIKLKDN